MNLRIRLEAEAVLGILEMVERGSISLVSSTLLEFEISKAPSSDHIFLAARVLKMASRIVSLTPAMIEQANRFVGAGLGSIDALHLSIANEEKLDYLCTCDDRFQKRCRRLPGLAVKAVLPLELIRILEP